MKNSLIITLAIVLASIFSADPIFAAPNGPGGEPNFHFVITEKRLWIVGDEFPLKTLEVKIMDESGKLVLEQNFSPKTERWFVDLTDLPEGKYKISAGDLETEWVKKPENQ